MNILLHFKNILWFLNVSQPFESPLMRILIRFVAHFEIELFLFFVDVIFLNSLYILHISFLLDVELVKNFPHSKGSWKIPSLLLLCYSALRGCIKKNFRNYWIKLTSINLCHSDTYQLSISYNICCSGKPTFAFLAYLNEQRLHNFL